MLKRKPKVLTPEQVEEIRTKDFFDMIDVYKRQIPGKEYVLKGTLMDKNTGKVFTENDKIGRASCRERV